MAEAKLKALSAALKHGRFPENMTMIDQDNKRWVKVSALLQSKRRFLALNQAEAVDAMTLEVDEAGRRRFRLYTDSSGCTWVNALNRAERMSGLF